MMQVSDRIRAIADGVSKLLVDEGKLIEAGWVAFRGYVVPPDASEVQINEMRLAYFAGAQHLFASINSIMEEGEEPTDADLRRMTLISDELAAFADVLAARVMPPAKGSA
jgi:hypothetical protein